MQDSIIEIDTLENDSVQFMPTIRMYTSIGTDHSLCTPVAFAFGAEPEEQDNLSKKKDRCGMEESMSKLEPIKNSWDLHGISQSPFLMMEVAC